tara:strand:- start:220 stop:720 length:501 start_codon:yes stop_codon:yes gene_type:complete
MSRKYRYLLTLFTAICLPALSITSPDWLKINGISPCWPVIWLLPFSLQNSPLVSAIAAVLIGLFMDSFKIGEVSYVPSLLILSLIWARHGKRNKTIKLFFNVGLMAMVGTFFVGLSFWMQRILLYNTLRNNWFNSWAIYLLAGELIITGLVAPLFTSWLLLTYKKN